MCNYIALFIHTYAFGYHDVNLYYIFRNSCQIACLIHTNDYLSMWGIVGYSYDSESFIVDNLWDLTADVIKILDDASGKDTRSYNSGITRKIIIVIKSAIVLHSKYLTLSTV